MISSHSDTAMIENLDKQNCRVRPNCRFLVLINRTVDDLITSPSTTMVVRAEM